MRAFRLLLFVAVLAVSGWLAAGHAFATPAAHPILPGRSYSGMLGVLWVDYEDGRAAPPQLFLHMPDGRQYELRAGAASVEQLLPYVGQSVTINGRLIQRGPTAEGEIAAGVIAVDAAPMLAEDTAAASMLTPTNPVLGNTRWVTIGCKFPDRLDEERPISFFDEMYSDYFPGLNHYWRELSNNRMNLDGSHGMGHWYILPQPYAAYFTSTGSFNTTQFMFDCLDTADSDVYFPDYYGINMIINGDDLGSAWGGRTVLTRDGIQGWWGVTWMSQWTHEKICEFGHEMGHTYGLGHSYVNYSLSPYANVWDVMSHDEGNCQQSSDPVYGCYGQHTIARNKAILGWIDPARVYVAGPGTHTVTLEQSAIPGLDGYLMVEIPVDGSTSHYFTLEARRLVGYDQQLRGNAVIIHEAGGPVHSVELRSITAYSEGRPAMWEPGETFNSGDGGISVHVDAATASGYQVTIHNGLARASKTLSPTDDTYVRRFAPYDNYGAEPLLMAEGQDATGWVNTRLAVKFDGQQIPDTVYRMRLRLAVVDDGGATIPSEMGWTSPYYAHTSTPWTELGLNYNNVSDFWPVGTHGVAPTREGDWVEWDVTMGPLYYGSPSFVNWSTSATVGGPFSFSSKEGANPPQLIVDYLVPADEVETCSQTADNVLANPSFEDGTTGWKFYTNGVGHINIADSTNGGAYECERAVQVYLEEVGTNSQLYQTGFPLKANTAYRFSFAAVSLDGADVRVRLQQHSAPYTFYGLNRVFDIKAGNWAEYSAEFTTTGFSGSTSDARLYFWFPGMSPDEGYYKIDRVRLEEVGAVPPTPTNTPAPPTPTNTPTATPISGGDCSVFPANVISNPSFEDGTRPWKFYSDAGGGFTTDAGSAYECAWGGRAAFNGAGKNQQLYQTGFPLSSGTRYRLSFAARSTDNRDLQVFIQRHTSPYTNYGLGQVVPLGPGWNEVSLEFTAGGFSGTSTDTRLRFWFAGLAQAGDVYDIDRVRLEEVGATPPTPTNTPAPPTPTNTPAPPTPSATPTATPISGGDCSVFPANVLANPSFEDGTRPWKYYSDAGGSFRTDPGSAYECAWGGRAAFDGAGKNQQLYQTSFWLLSGARYRLSFAARSTDGRDLQVFIHRHTSPYTSFGLGETVALNPGWNEVSLEFTATGFSGASQDTRLRFWFAGLAGAGDIYDIDRVRLEALP